MGVVQPLRPDGIMGASSNARILASDAQDDQVDLVGQVRANADYTNHIVVDDITTPV